MPCSSKGLWSNVIPVAEQPGHGWVSELVDPPGLSSVRFTNPESIVPVYAFTSGIPLPEEALGAIQ